MTRWLAILLAGVLAGCAARGPAPVVDRSSGRTTYGYMRPAPVVVTPSGRPQIEPSDTGFHIVDRGDTLYSIAFANGLDVREVATWNQLEDPNVIQVGQRLRLTPPPGADVRPLAETLPLEGKPLTAVPLPPADNDPLVREPQAQVLPWSEANWKRVSAPATLKEQPAVQTAVAVVPPTVSMQAPAEPVTTASGWQWPAEGVLAARFGGNGGKGIDIVGPRDSVVRAAAAGKVVYSGTGLRGYGRLLIVKHAGDFLSAYAHNDSVVVKEGEQVKAGQIIARMGDSDADRVKLHFEIRRFGKPLDPLEFLPERS